MLQDLLLNKSSETSFDSLIQTLLQQAESRRHCQKSTARHTEKKTAPVQKATGTAKRTRRRTTWRRIRTTDSRRKSPETEDFDTSSSEGYSDY
nr:MAG: ORF3 [Giant panda anellovirus]